MPVPRDDPPAPPHIPDYALLREIGRGSYGAVWLARSVTGHHRAVKIVWRASFEDPQPYEREFRGIKEFAAVSLTEPRQLALLHVGRNDAEGFFYCVMELADDAETGREIDPARYVPLTLREKRTRRGRFPAHETLALGVDLASALAGLHTHGLVHRDIKPSNIIYVGGVPKLADIGLVTTAANAELTISRVGNAGYMPPDFPGTASADVYGLAKVLYELVTGRVREDFPRLPIDLGAFPDRKGLLELNEIFAKACDPNPEKRYRDATTLRDELLLLQAGKSVRRLRATERHLARALKVAAVLAVAAVIASGAAWLATREARKEMVLREKAEAERDLIARRRAYAGNLASAQRAVQNHEYQRARSLLDAVAWNDMRGFEWHYLWAQAQPPPHEAVSERGPAIGSLHISPDESVLAVQQAGNEVVLYRLDDYREVHRVRGVGVLAGFSPDGRMLIGADPEFHLRRWAASASGQDETSAASGRPVALLPDGSAVVYARDNSVLVWDFSAQHERARVSLKASEAGADWGFFRQGAAEDGRTIVFAWVRGIGSRAEFRLTAITLGAAPAVYHTTIGRNRPSAVGADSRGPWAVLDVTGAVWRLSDGQWHPTDERMPLGTRCYRETAAPTRAIFAHGRALSWQADGEAHREAHAHTGLVVDFAIAPRRQKVFSAAGDGAIYAWPMAGPMDVPSTFQAWNSNAGTTGACFTADGASLWVPLDGATTVRLATRDLSPMSRVDGMMFPFGLVEGKLLGISTDTAIVQSDAVSGAVLSRREVSPSFLRSAVMSADSTRIAALDDAGALWALDSSGARRVGDALSRTFAIRLAADGSQLWMLDVPTRSLTCLNWPAGTLRWRRPLSFSASGMVVLSPERLLISLENGRLDLRSARDGNTLRLIDAGSASPQCLALSPDGRRVFVGGIEGNIHCLDTTTWEEMHTLSLGAEARLQCLACSPDGSSLAALTKTGVLHVLRAGR